jgi:hypothetical protein
VATMRVTGLVLLLVAGAACAPRATSVAPRPIKPEDGPKASIHASYSGGLTYRTVNASFHVEQNAYVVVAHLAGDGVIRIVHPQTPQESGRVWTGKRVSVRPIMSRFDGAPSLLSLGRAPFRTTSAMMDSYDGGGHGFVFLVATRYPMNFDAVSDGYEWDEFALTDYLTGSDPRVAIRTFADRMTGGGGYTLRFATSMSTLSFVSYAAMADDCALLSSLGYGYASGFWGSWGFAPLRLMNRSPFYYYPGSRNACYPSYSYAGASYLYGRRYYDENRWNTLALGPRRPPVGGPTTPTPVTPTLTRPTYRAPDDFTRHGIARVAVERPTATTRASSARRWQNGSDGDAARSRPFGRPTTSSGGNRDVGARGNPGGSDSPRSSSGGASAGPRAGPSSSAPASRPATTTSTTSTTSTKKHQ